MLLGQIFIHSPSVCGDLSVIMGLKAMRGGDELVWRRVSALAEVVTESFRHCETNFRLGDGVAFAGRVGLVGCRGLKYSD